METSLLKTLRQIAGLAGISLGVFLLLFVNLSEKNFSNVTSGSRISIDSTVHVSNFLDGSCRDSSLGIRR